MQIDKKCYYLINVNNRRFVHIILSKNGNNRAEI